MCMDTKILATSGAYALQFRPAGDYSVGGAFKIHMDAHWRVLRQVAKGISSVGFFNEAEARAHFELVAGR